MPKKLILPTPQLIKAQQRARDILRGYFRSDHGVQAQLARDTGIQASFLSSMAHDDDRPVSLENAILMDVATKGALKAEVLCPARADKIKQFIASRTKAEA